MYLTKADPSVTFQSSAKACEVIVLPLPEIYSDKIRIRKAERREEGKKRWGKRGGEEQ